ncbi:VTT domain-containing protein [Candidatus Woesearchaeota archaeon]|nr:VTT domain-containing protein [Candidatus Woesearchaeota archaeon]
MLDKLNSFFHLLYSLPELIALGGYTALFLIIFAETGLMVGFFLPGDSLLVTAGLFAARGDLNIYYLILLLSFAAVAGDSVSYFIGSTAGNALFRREDSRFFKKKYLLAAQAFYERHGKKTILLARFVPVIRTFAPVVAGIAKMKYSQFFMYNLFGGILWVASMLLVGFFLGKSVPNIEENIHIVIFIVIALSFVPVIVEHIRIKKKQASELSGSK